MAEDEKNPTDLGHSLYTVEPSPLEAKNAQRWIKRARDKRALNSLENPFEDDRDIIGYLDRAIDNAQNPLDQLELKMLHESLCREIHKEKPHKVRAVADSRSSIKITAENRGEKPHRLSNGSKVRSPTAIRGRATPPQRGGI